jgi:predicted dehydrogenase
LGPFASVFDPCCEGFDSRPLHSEAPVFPSTTTDWRALVARPDLDAVVLATPNALHRPQALAAIAAGRHVVCERPLALDAAQAREMAARAGEAARATLTFFTHRAVGAAAHVKRLVDAGFLGRPLYVSAEYFTGSQLRPGKTVGA